MLKLKAKCLFVLLSVLIAIPMLPMSLLYLVLYYGPFLGFLRDTAEGLIKDCERMLLWREATLYWFVKDRQRGYSLTID